MLRVTDGDNLIEALQRATQGGEGWVQATGTVEAVELEVARGDAAERVTHEPRATLVSLQGSTDGPFSAVIARVVEGRIETLAGVLVRARSRGVTALLSAVPPSVGQPRVLPANKPAEPNRDESGASAPLPWAAKAVRVAARNAEPIEEEILPEPGDLVHHFAFGLCDVLMLDGDHLKLRDHANPNRLREIRVDVLRVLPPVEQDGKRLFKLVRKT